MSLKASFVSSIGSLCCFDPYVVTILPEASQGVRHRYRHQQWLSRHPRDYRQLHQGCVFVRSLVQARHKRSAHPLSGSTGKVCPTAFLHLLPTYRTTNSGNGKGSGGRKRTDIGAKQICQARKKSSVPSFPRRREISADFDPVSQKRLRDSLQPGNNTNTTLQD